jgi:hypothetical protein
MENFARRGIRATVAVAGLAALGVGLAAPTAFALPGVPDIGGVGNTETTPSAGTPSNFGGAAGAFGALPERFQFAPPAAAPSESQSQSASRSAEPADDESTGSETTPSSDSSAADSTAADDTQADGTEADPESTSDSTSESTEAAPVTTPSTPSRGLLPAIPGSPVAAQASPQVSGVDPSSALQSLDSGSMF